MIDATQAVRGFADDGAAPYFDGVQQVRARLVAALPLYCIDVNADLAIAAEAQRSMELMGRCLVTIDAERAQDVAEAAQERAAIQAENGGAVRGLVSVPTSDKGRSAVVAASDALALRTALKATEVDKRKSRVSRLRRAVGFSARAIGAALDRPGFRGRYVAMLTLTYANGDDWQPLHVAALLKNVREFMRKAGHSMHYVWVAELQKRGALHYHIGLWLPQGFTIPKPDECGWWPHGWTNITEARRAVPYLLKYMSKAMDCEGFPKGARVYGVGGVETALRRARRWLGYPAFIKARADISDDWRRAPGGGWSDPDGVVVPSEFERCWIGDRWACVQVNNYGRPFDASGPFSWITRSPFHA